MIKDTKNWMLVAGVLLLLCGSTHADAADAADTPAAAVQAISDNTVQNAQAQPALTYLYESKEYGYRIMCPKRPVGVIPAATLFENRKGEILIFENEEYNIKHAWVILVDAFSDTAVPDLNTINPEDATKLLAGIMGSNGYEGIMLVNLTEHNKAIFAMTAKEVEIDEDGDGVVDATATADNQMAVLFFRGANGARYGLQLMDNPTLRAASVSEFLAGARTLTQAS